MRRKILVLALSAGFLGVGSASAWATTVSIGGGTWNYGVTLGIGKTSYSQYVHPTKYHYATAVCGSIVDKRSDFPTNWANAKAQCNRWDNTAAYWSVK